MKNKFFALVCGVMLILSSCQQRKKITTTHYPMDSLIVDQVVYLAKNQATLQKETMLNDSVEVVVLKLSDSLSWIRELDIFYELNAINKPISTGSYSVNDGVRDTQSNLIIKSFITEEELPIRELRVYYFNQPENVRKIEALYQEQNALLISTRLLQLNFQDINNKTVLTSYHITGGQKMFMGDSVKFSVNGTITLQ